MAHQPPCSKRMCTRTNVTHSANRHAYMFKLNHTFFFPAKFCCLLSPYLSVVSILIVECGKRNGVDAHKAVFDWNERGV